ncbi:MAG: MarC family protein [Fimbriiglobus sp.]|jgi:multiple antibiotic resistance protein|nr:MarC family protein [Fimbriiglobus sp.]
MWDFALTAFTSILFLVDPPGCIPAYLALTSRYTPAKRKRTALIACITATLVMSGFGIVGTWLFHFLGLSLPAFKIAGGLVLFLVAIDMIRAQRSTQEDPEEMQEGKEASDVAIAPLAVPLLAGPAALSTVTVLVAKASNFGEVMMVHLAVLLTGAVGYITFRLAEPIQRRLGTTGIHVLGRILGLVLAGIAVQFVLDGLTGAGVVAKPAAPVAGH